MISLKQDHFKKKSHLRIESNDQMKRKILLLLPKGFIYLVKKSYLENKYRQRRKRYNKLKRKRMLNLGRQFKQNNICHLLDNNLIKEKLPYQVLKIPQKIKQQLQIKKEYYNNLVFYVIIHIEEAEPIEELELILCPEGCGRQFK